MNLQRSYSESSTKIQWWRERRPNVVVFVVWSTLNADGWVVVALRRQSYLGLAEILCTWYNLRVGDTG